jgi:hypothetical protein
MKKGIGCFTDLKGTARYVRGFVNRLAVSSPKECEKSARAAAARKSHFRKETTKQVLHKSILLLGYELKFNSPYFAFWIGLPSPMGPTMDRPVLSRCTECARPGRIDRDMIEMIESDLSSCGSTCRSCPAPLFGRRHRGNFLPGSSRLHDSLILVQCFSLQLSIVSTQDVLQHLSQLRLRAASTDCVDLGVGFCRERDGEAGVRFVRLSGRVRDPDGSGRRRERGHRRDPPSGSDVSADPREDQRPAREVMTGDCRPRSTPLFSFSLIRGRDCTHYESFDARPFLSLLFLSNKGHGAGSAPCPHCRLRLRAEDLVKCGFTLGVLRSQKLPGDATHILVGRDLVWTPESLPRVSEMIEPAFACRLPGSENV